MKSSTGSNVLRVRTCATAYECHRCHAWRPARLVARTTGARRSRRPDACARRGFTLVEVTIAMVILATVFIGALSTVIVASRIVHAARETTCATTVLNNCLEELRAMPFAQVAAMADDSGAYLRDDDGPGEFKWSRTFGRLAGDPDIVVVTVRVDWTQNNRPRTVESIGYIAKSGIVNRSES